MPPGAEQASAPLHGPRRPGWAKIERPAQGRVLGGVAVAVADRLDVAPVAVRLALVALSFVGGTGIALYVLGWLLLAPAGGGVPLAQEAWGDRRTVSAVVAVATVLVASLVAVSAISPGFLLGTVTPGVVMAAGLVAVGRHAQGEDRLALQRTAAMFGLLPTASAQGHRRQVVVALVRAVLGVVLVAIGAAALLAPQHITGADAWAAADAACVLVGFALVLAPWWARLARELASERNARTRAQERAEMAEHLHDSVLQTLALIQRTAGDPAKVVKLARAQERQLRRWLFDNSGPGGPSTSGAATLGEALEALQLDVESSHDIKVDLVTVGDAPFDAQLSALVAAAREAVVNAAKWSGADLVSVFSEVEEGYASVFVLDRGVGFDLSQVGPDRKGISESIRARVTRKGGTVTLRSNPGQGTEVTLRVPRRPGQ